MNKAILLNIILFIIIILNFGCGGLIDTYYMETEPTTIGIKDENTLILRVFYRFSQNQKGWMFDAPKELNSFYYLLEKDINQDKQWIKGEKNLGGNIGIIYHNDIIGLGNIGLGDYSFVKFLNSNTYQIIKSVNFSIGTFHDFTNDSKKILFNYFKFSEYNCDNGLSTQLLPYDVLDAKYCPINENFLAYIGETITANNISGDLYTMNNDGTNINTVLAGYNVIKICWKPDGKTIVFLNNNGIWNINDDGSGLIKILDFNLPTKYKSIALYYNLIAYIDEDGKVVSVKF